jgi:hypothetical protein
LLSGSIDRHYKLVGVRSKASKKHPEGVERPLQVRCHIVLTLVERGGIARSFHIDTTAVARVVPIVNANIAKESALMTDEARHYVNLGKTFAFHYTRQTRPVCQALHTSRGAKCAAAVILLLTLFGVG